MKRRNGGRKTYQLEEDEGEDAREKAHDGNPHDDFEDVVFVVGLVLGDLDLLVKQEGTAEGVQHNHRLGKQGMYDYECM